MHKLFYFLENALSKTFVEVTSKQFTETLARLHNDKVFFHIVYDEDRNQVTVKYWKG